MAAGAVLASDLVVGGAALRRRFARGCPTLFCVNLARWCKEDPFQTLVYGDRRVNRLRAGALLE